MKARARRPRMCRKFVSEYMGTGGPPLFAPLPMELRCTRGFGHSGECQNIHGTEKTPEFDYDSRIREIKA